MPRMVAVVAGVGFGGGGLRRVLVLPGELPDAAQRRLGRGPRGGTK